jgi:general secretion pathway protein C
MTVQHAGGLQRVAFDWERKAPLLVSAVLGAAVLVDGVRFCRDLYWDLRPLPVVGSPRWQPSADGFLAAGSIKGAHLFGAAPEESHGPAVENGSPRPVLVLTGVIALADPSRGLAIIGPERADRLFQVSAELPDGSLLREVYPDRVVLERSGARETLMLRKRNAAIPALLTLAPTPRMEDVPASEPGGGTVTKDPREFSTARRWFNGLSARQAPSPDGRFEGFALHPMPRYKRDYGVRDGDVVTEINGVPLDDPDTAARVLQQARGSKVSVTIQRDGAPQQLTFDVGS